MTHTHTLTQIDTPTRARQTHTDTDRDADRDTDKDRDGQPPGRQAARQRTDRQQKQKETDTHRDTQRHRHNGQINRRTAGGRTGGRAGRPGTHQISDFGMTRSHLNRLHTQRHAILSLVESVDLVKKGPQPTATPRCACRLLGLLRDGYSSWKPLHASGQTSASQRTLARDPAGPPCAGVGRVHARLRILQDWSCRKSALCLQLHYQSHVFTKETLWSLPELPFTNSPQ